MTTEKRSYGKSPDGTMFYVDSRGVRHVLGHGTGKIEMLVSHEPVPANLVGLQFGSIIGDDLDPPWRGLVLGRFEKDIYTVVVLTEGDYVWGTWPRGEIVRWRSDQFGRLSYYGHEDGL